MNLAIVGSRDFHDRLKFNQVMAHYDLNNVARIISGGCSGADHLAEQFAREHNIPLKIHPAEWSKYGKRAGAIRNQLIVNDADRMVAFVSKNSRGTHISIDMARRKNIPVHVIEVGGRCAVPLPPLAPRWVFE